MATVLVSTCGTSHLTHGLSAEDRLLLNRWAHAKQERDIEPSDRSRIERIVFDQQQRLLDAEPAEARDLSAELNGILAYAGNLAEVCTHYLVHTDTFLGRHAATVVRDWLAARGADVRLKTFEGMQVVDQKALDQALADAARWAAEELEWVRLSPEHRLVFNTTGGFKAVQGFFQTLGVMFADETVYVFEQSDALVRIPRLPLRADLSELAPEQLVELRRLSQGLEGTCVELPETLALDGRITAYGSLLVKKWWDDAADKALLPPISRRLRYGPGLEKSVQQYFSRKGREINRKLEQIAFVHETGLDLAGVDIHPIHSGQVGVSTHLADAWHDGGAKRFYLHYEGDVLVADKLDEGLGH